MDTKKNFGDRLLYLLSKKDMSQKELSSKLGVNPATINKYIKGTRFPDENTITRLAEIFDTTIDFLYGKTDSPRGYVIMEQTDKYEVTINDNDLKVDRKKLEELLQKLIPLGVNPNDLQ